MRRAALVIVAAALAACAARRDSAPPSVESPPAVAGIESVIETPHVRLVTTLGEGDLRRDLAPLLEQCVASFIAMTPGGREPVIEVRFFDTESAWRGAVQAHARRRLGRTLPLGSGLSRAAVTIEGTSFLFDIGGADALRLAAHEAWHAYAYRALESPLPLWLDEALACRAEGFYWDTTAQTAILRASANPTRRAHVRRLLDAGRLGSLEDHLRADPTKLTDSRRALDDYYARAWILGVVLDDARLADSLADTLGRAARGTLPESTGNRVGLTLGITAVELETMWRTKAREIASD